MDREAEIKDHRSVEQDALRLLTVVHQLGREVSAGGLSGGGLSGGGLRAVDTESRLQRLDHLVREPVALAFVLMDLVREHPELADRQESLARRVRSLLADGTDRSFTAGAWKRWDDVLAFVGCRGLLRVEALSGAPGEVRYLLTERGAAFLQDRIYPSRKRPAPYVERCRLLAEVLPLIDGDLGHHLQAAARRLEGFRRDEQVAVEDDLRRRFFHAAFAAQLS